MKTKKHIYLLSFFLFFSVQLSYSQHVISGFVRDANTGEALINAHIYNKKTREGTLTNPYGFFNLNTSTKNNIQLQVSYVGYTNQILDLQSLPDSSVMVRLKPMGDIQTVEVRALKISDEAFTPAARMSFTGEQLDKLPGLLGEKDIIKSLQLMPGITKGKEGGSGLFVRGGDRGQNLILLDGMPVYNINHLFGFFSVFTPEMVKSVDVYKGGFPARYSGRLSSVIDIRLKEGNLYQKELDFTIGTLSSKLIFETPIKKGKSSFALAARRTYADLLYTPLNAVKQEGLYKTTQSWSGYNFYDINAKANFILSSKDRIYISFYSGKDKLFNSEKDIYPDKHRTNSTIDFSQLKNQTQIHNNWGNLTLSFRWNHLFSKKLFANTTLSYSNYEYQTAIEDDYYQEAAHDTINEHTAYINLSSIKDFGLTSDLEYSAFRWLKILGGIKINKLNFIPGKLDLHYHSEFSPSDDVEYNLHHSSEEQFTGNAYIENHINVSNKLFMNAGASLLAFKQSSNTYYSLTPRLMVAYHFNSNISVNASYTRMTQPIHLLVENANLLPIDMWVPSVSNLTPAKAKQFDAGMSFKIKNGFKFEAGLFCKEMTNLIHFRDGESFFSLDQAWSEKVTQGSGTSKGVEVLFSKNVGKLQGWIAYTLSESTRKFVTLNHGKEFPFKYDSRNQFKLVGNYRLNKRMLLNMAWEYSTGTPITLSTQAYSGDSRYARNPLSSRLGELGNSNGTIFKPQHIVYYDEINQQRLPAYHRLDMGISFIKQKKRGERTISFSIYNVYARNNPMMIFSEVGNSGEIAYKGFSVLTFVPALSYRFKFNPF